jgi:hypothetical protein
MDQKNYEQEDRKNLILGSIFLTIFLILIFAGIFVKRVMGHPEFMMAFHGPAAVFLVIGGMKVMAKHKRKNQRLQAGKQL